MVGRINAYVYERLRLQRLEGGGGGRLQYGRGGDAPRLTQGCKLPILKSMRMLQKTGHAVFRLIQASVRPMRAEIKKAGEKEKKDKK